jgi:hypothetical protein
MKDTSKAKFQRPYCGSPFDDKEALSKHIDRLHEETGILEGDYRKMVHRRSMNQMVVENQ